MEIMQTYSCNMYSTASEQKGAVIMDFSAKLKRMMAQLDISNAQLAKALNVDPSLISRWLKSGCGERKAAEHALAIEGYILRRQLTPENKSWLYAEIGKPLGAETVALARAV